jgi:hypothetical protein
MSVPGIATIITTKGPVTSVEYFAEDEECGEETFADGSLIGEDE